MSTAIPHYLAFATHPALRGRSLAGRAMLAVDAEERHVVFANAAGARLLGQSLISAAIGTDAAENILLRQFMAVAGRLAEPGDTRNFTVNIPQRFRRVARQAIASLLVLGGRRYLILECENDIADDVMQDLVSGFGEDEAQLALVDGKGAVTHRSAGFDRTGLDSTEIGPVIESLAAGPEYYTERLATTQTGIWPLALGRLSRAPGLFLLFVSEYLAADLKPIDETAGEDAAPDTNIRSARDVIATIDESLGALLGQEDTTAQPAETQSPVVRRQPAAAAEKEALRQAAETRHAEADTRRPARFVWHTDAAGRLIDVSDELAGAVGPDMAAVTGLDFAEIETRFKVAGGSAIARLLQSADTWSGHTVHWPVSGTSMAVPVDLAALPTYTRERHFDGFRGYGLIRLGEETQVPDAAPAAANTAERTKQAQQLTEAERHALDEIASQLRSADTQPAPTPSETVDVEEAPPAPARAPVILRRTAEHAPQNASGAADHASAIDDKKDAILIQSGERILHTNSAFLSLAGYGSLDAVIAAGGTDALIERGTDDRLFLHTADGGRLPVSLHLQAIVWHGGRALALTLRPEHETAGRTDLPVFKQDTDKAGDNAQMLQDGDVAELHAILDTSTDGILILDEKRHIRSLSSSASALFGVESQDVIGEDAGLLFAEESHNDLESHLERLIDGRGGDVMHEGLEVIGREAGGGLIPLFITLGRLPQSGGICAILRDVTALKRREEDLRSAKRAAREAEDERDSLRSALRYELSQPLDAIISLSETMDHQPFGALGDSRYHGLAREIASKSRHARGVVGRLLGEPAPTEPSEAAPDPVVLPEEQVAPAAHETAQINDAVAEAVSLVQPRANARRIIIRAALSPALARTPSDAETLKEIALQLLQGAVQFTPAGGQVVVSTAVAASGETVLRFRDNGIAPARRRAAGQHAGDTAPQEENPHLQKARKLAERLGARFLVHAVPSEGMLVEVFLPIRETRPLHY
ncbi:UNVERIFIED_ORG: PAS domain S-box-containing protein [Martelella mediterranea]